ncbi:MAG: type II toxin-antitoxin system VapC family toxin [Smithellaceae bacterium]|nr:type II toxin-antitoxin system VapC family toxin [Smithellaceae bacterium]
MPAIWPLEVSNVLLAAECRKRLSQADRSYFISLLLELPVIVEQESPERMLSEILALAMRKGLPLATTDMNVIAAAKRSSLSIIK